LDYGLAIAILVMFGVVALRLNSVESRRVGGTIVVNDGDSLTVNQQRVRLQGIDAPEYDQTCQRAGTDYPCGRESRKALSALVAGGGVVCEGWQEDRFGRLLAVCRAGGVDLNRRQVEAGWAISYGGYEDAERAARDAKKGLWAGVFDRPRDWRDQHGGLAENEHDAFNAIIDWLKRGLGFS